MGYRFSQKTMEPIFFFFLLFYSSKPKNKQIRSFMFWKNLRPANLLAVLSDFYSPPVFSDLPKALHDLMFCDQKTCNGNETLHKKWIGFSSSFFGRIENTKKNISKLTHLYSPPGFSDLPKALLDLMFCDQKTCNGNETLHKKWIGLKGVKFFCENAFVKILQPCQRIKCNLVFSFDLSYM